MKWILIVTVMHLNGVHEASRYDYSNLPVNIVECNDYGRQWSNWYMTHIPDVTTVTWECLKSQMKSR